MLLPPGYLLTGYSTDGFAGDSWTRTANNPDLRVTGGNDAIVSLRLSFDPAR